MAKKKEEVKVTPKLVDFARRLRVYKDKKDQLKDDLKELNKTLEVFNKEFVELMQDNEISTFKVDKAGTCYIEPDIYPDVVDSIAFIKWLDDNGFGSLAVRTVHPQTLKSFCKEQLAAKNLLPKGITIYPKPMVKIRRSKSKGGSDEEK